MKRLTETLLKEIETEAIYGNIDDEGKLNYRSIKQLAKDYSIDYDNLRKKAGKGKWLSKRKASTTKIAQKVDDKKCEYNAQKIVQSDDKFISTAEKMRMAIDIQLDQILEAQQDPDKWVKSSDFKYIGDGLKAVQDVIKTAQGDNTQKIEVKEVDVYDRVKERAKHYEQINTKSNGTD